MTMGDRIKLARREIGLNQADFAELVGVEPATVSRWESDLVEPRAATIPIIAKVLGKSVSYIVGGDEHALSSRLEKIEQSLTEKNSAEILLPAVRELTDILATLDQNQLNRAKRQILAIKNAGLNRPLKKNRNLG